MLYFVQIFYKFTVFAYPVYYINDLVTVYKNYTKLKDLSQQLEFLGALKVLTTTAVILFVSWLTSPSYASYFRYTHYAYFPSANPASRYAPRWIFIVKTFKLTAEQRKTHYHRSKQTTAITQYISGPNGNSTDMWYLPIVKYIRIWIH